MLELYEQNRVPQSQGGEVEGSAGGASSHRPQKTPAAAEEQASKQTSLRLATEHSHPENNGASSRAAQNNQSNDDGSGEMGSVTTDHKADAETKDNQHPEQLSQKENMREVPNKSKSASERTAEDQGRAAGRHNNAEAGEWRDDGASHKSSSIGGRNLDIREGPVGQSPKDAIKMIDEDKVKAIREKRRKSRGEPMRKKDFMDEDDLIERELEDIEIPVDDEKMKREQRQSWSKSHENSDHGKGHGEVGDGNHLGTKGQSSKGLGAENAEEGEMVDDGSPMLNSRKRKAGSPVDRQSEGKKQHEYMSSYNHDNIEDGHKMSRPSYSDREYRRHAQENHL